MVAGTEVEYEIEARIAGVEPIEHWRRRPRDCHDSEEEEHLDAEVLCVCHRP